MPGINDPRGVLVGWSGSAEEGVSRRWFIELLISLLTSLQIRLVYSMKADEQPESYRKPPSPELELLRLRRLGHTHP